MTHIDRRYLLLGATALVGTTACGAGTAVAQNAADRAFANDPMRKLTDAQWRARIAANVADLPARQHDLAYQVLRHEATEYAGTGPFLNEKRKGVFHCRGCDLPLFRSEWKYESGTGWPSFFQKITANVGEKRDADGSRTEYHCARCQGHQGHVFDDGPAPTGLRYCNNGVSVVFRPG